ncbi:MAG: hypothetical protein QOE70_3340 [Chthoniobacter sp.]|jgi:uncharacterized protein (TIGR03118 family)|nr:hypothetical protein [Chthoniobacter sp.]
MKIPVTRSRWLSNYLRRLLLLLLLSGGILAESARALGQGNTFQETILVASNGSYQPAAFIDAHIENAWGIALRPPGAGGHIWVSNARNASTSLYIGDVNGIPLHQDGLKILQLDGPLISYEGGLPQTTGQVYNAASDLPNQPTEFPVSGPASNWSSGTAVPIGNISGPAKFVFVTKDGTINAWRANTAASMNTAIVAMDYSDHGKDQLKELPFLPAFTGVAITTEPPSLNDEGQAVADNRLYVTDFQNKIIRVINNQWTDITVQVPFERPAGLAEGMSPYNIQDLNGKLYVTYAAVDTTSEEPAFDVPEEGGHVFVYDRDGHLLHGFQDEGLLRSPWGLAIAPAGFGKFGGKLLVASFGDGTIAAFDPNTGDFADLLRNPQGEPLKLDGLWGLAFGNGVSLGDASALYYTAGPNKEQDGVFGRVNAITTAAPAVSVAAAAAPVPARPANPVLSSAAADRQTVRDFGAVGDGNADDTAAIEKAAQSGSIVFPSGTYRLTRTIKIDLAPPASPR